MYLLLGVSVSHKKKKKIKSLRLRSCNFLQLRLARAARSARSRGRFRAAGGRSANLSLRLYLPARPREPCPQGLLLEAHAPLPWDLQGPQPRCGCVLAPAGPA